MHDDLPPLRCYLFAFAILGTLAFATIVGLCRLAEWLMAVALDVASSITFT